MIKYLVRFLIAHSLRIRTYIWINIFMLINFCRLRWTSPRYERSRLAIIKFLFCLFNCGLCQITGKHINSFQWIADAIWNGCIDYGIPRIILKIYYLITYNLLYYVNIKKTFLTKNNKNLQVKRNVIRLSRSAG